MSSKSGEAKKSTDGGRAESELPATLKNASELHRSDEILNKIFDNTHIQIAYLDRDFNFVRINRAYAEASGHEPEFFEGKNHFEVYPNPENEALFRQVRDEGEPCSINEKAFEYPDQPGRGITYWDVNISPIRGEQGLVEGLLLCLVDVSERVKARRRKEEADKKYRDLVENANSIIIRVTPDLRIMFCNEYAQRFFGYSADEMLGRSVFETIVPPSDSEGRDLRAMALAIAEQPELHGTQENENICKDGRRVWIHWSNRALRDGRGAVQEILCVGTDMTEQVRLARQAAVYQRRLQGLADRLTATEEDVRRRVATYIHDTVVQTLSLSNIRLGGVAAELEKTGMKAQVERIAGVRQLLDQGTTECRGLMEELLPSLLYEVGLSAAIKDFARQQSRADGTKIVFTGDDHFPLDDARRSLLFQCMRELAMNALKHAGSCEIGIALSSGDGHVQLSVSDTGRGFDPGQLDCADFDHSDGGFGLFNIRERLEGLGGALEIDSAPGKGTRATVRVPVSCAS